MKLFLNPSSAGTVFVYGRYMMYKNGPSTERIKIVLMAILYTHNISIQINQKELTKTFIMISKRKNPFGLHGL